MGRINYIQDITTGNYIVIENGIRFEMSMSYMNRLNKWIGKFYSFGYSEGSEGVLKWYNGLLFEEKRDIKVQGLNKDTGFFADTFYED